MKKNNSTAFLVQNSLGKKLAPFPILTREEQVSIMVEAWEAVPKELGRDAWSHVQLMPYARAEREKWTVEAAFKGVQKDLFPWYNFTDKGTADAVLAELKKLGLVMPTHRPPPSAPLTQVPDVAVSNNVKVPGTCDPAAPTETVNCSQSIPKIADGFQDKQLTCYNEQCACVNKLTRWVCQKCQIPAHAGCLWGTNCPSDFDL
jgi:hypothetical protein